MPDPVIHDVIIAGAGPVGLFLARELRLAGVSVLVLEQAAHPDSPLKTLPFGMRGLSALTIDAFYRRGLLDALTASDPVQQQARGGKVAAGAHWMQQPRRPGGHFAGIQFFHDKFDTSTWPYHIPGPAPMQLATTMQRIEVLLADRAIALGADIRRGLGVEGVAQSDDGVSVHAGGAQFEGRWLVGCDGGRSTVRKAAGIEFIGTEPELTGYSVQVELDDPDTLLPGRQYTASGMYTYQKPGIVAMVDFDGGACHRSLPITREHVQAVLQRVSGTGVKVTRLDLATTWTDRACQAATYRKGRVLLAGDAAHVHSPLGGQGLNLGLGDAMNLGWKLAATIRGHAPDGLLDSYARERQPIGAQVLDWSRAQVALMRPNPGSRALAAVMRDLMDTGDGASYFADRVWGMSLAYDLGGAHPLVGRSVPDFALADGTRCGGYFSDAKGVLLDFGPGMPLQSLAQRWHDRIRYVAARAEDTLGLSAVLVRPDGVVAWVGESGPLLEPAAKAAARWFGRP